MENGLESKDEYIYCFMEANQKYVHCIQKWSIVMDQIPLHKSKQKPFVVCCALGIVPRLGEDEFQIIVKLSWLYI